MQLIKKLLNLPGQLDRYTRNLVPVQNIANWRIPVQPSLSCGVSLVLASISHINQVISPYLQVISTKYRQQQAQT